MKKLLYNYLRLKEDGAGADSKVGMCKGSPSNALAENKQSDWHGLYISLALYAKVVPGCATESS